ncbi:MAG: hypothetical protein AVDCRST_MAG41-2166 [uncultured Corynebacteriales bacterium]|uniref:TauD/TfdA-like domain-containing protein n=1 Tax=uncultured Mycobacteriales bacterium TaxID=581187 RepID=A0A6J4INW8_9ACTN|nr:MAG: hypothetical protein AVDCRST_MAG41-2166 [uncultured Corynebacteriales bacterium]
MTVPDTTVPAAGRHTEHRIELTEQERVELAALAERLARTPPALLDDEEFLQHARQLSCHLPVRLRAALRRYRHDPGGDGTLFVANLPVDEDALAPTPGTPDSVELEASVASVLPVLLGLHLGEVVAYRDEKLGALVQNVVPVPGLERSQSNAGSVPLKFHVENAFHPHRPDYVGLMCLRNDHARQAGTLVSSIRRALPLLAEEDAKVLCDARFVTAPPPSFRSGADTLPHAVLDGTLEDPNICVDFNATVALDGEAAAALDRLHAALEEVATSLVLQSGQMTFLDNRIALHGRSSFRPRYDGRDRWLHRVYVHLDNRRNRASRLGNGSVLA